MTGKQLTAYTLIGTLAGLGIVEIRSFITKEEGDTISSRLADTIDQYPVVAGVITGVVAHCCTPTRIPDEPLPWWRNRTVAFMSGAILGLTWCRYDKKRPRN